MLLRAAAPTRDPGLRWGGTSLSPYALIRWSGLCAILGGVLVAAFPLVHPNHDAAGYTSTTWVPAHLMPHVGAVLALFALLGLFARQFERAGWLGLAGFVAAVIGTASLLTGAMIEAFIIPFMGLQTPEIVDGPPPPGVGEAFMTISILFTFGWVLLGIATARAHVLPRSVGILLAVGAVVLMFGDSVTSGLLGYDNLWGIGFALFGAALAWLGYALWSDPSTVRAARRSSRSQRTPRIVEDSPIGSTRSLATSAPKGAS